VSFLTALREDRVQLSAAGLFNVGIQLAPGVNKTQLNFGSGQ